MTQKVTSLYNSNNEITYNVENSNLKRTKG